MEPSAFQITLQVISAAAIVGFGLFQAVMAVRMRRGSGEEHKEFMTAWRDQHQQTMQTLSQQREADMNRHEEAMTTLRDSREESQDQHTQNMTALSAQQQSISAIDPNAIADTVMDRMRRPPDGH